MTGVSSPRIPPGLRDIEKSCLLSLLLQATVLGGEGLRKSGAVLNSSRVYTPPANRTLGHLARVLFLGGPFCAKPVPLWGPFPQLPQPQVRPDFQTKKKKRIRLLGLRCQTPLCLLNRTSNNSCAHPSSLISQYPNLTE